MSGAVPSNYRHHPKSVYGRADIVFGSVHLKWYDIATANTSVPAEIENAARKLIVDLLATGAIQTHDDRGFVILHQCGEDFYFLLLQIWRGANELWEAVYAKDGDTPFEAFAPAYPGPGNLRPTFCVWELGVVAYEAQAWTRFLSSTRDARAREIWAGARFAGHV